TQPIALPEALRERLGLEQRTAVIVVNVRPDSPAGAAGLIIGDILVSIDDDPIAEPEDLVGALRPERVGQTVTARIVRGGEPREPPPTACASARWSSRSAIRSGCGGC